VDPEKNQHTLTEPPKNEDHGANRVERRGGAGRIGLSKVSATGMKSIGDPPIRDVHMVDSCVS